MMVCIPKQGFLIMQRVTNIAEFVCGRFWNLQPTWQKKAQNLCCVLESWQSATRWKFFTIFHIFYITLLIRWWSTIFPHWKAKGFSLHSVVLLRHSADCHSRQSGSTWNCWLCGEFLRWICVQVLYCKIDWNSGERSEFGCFQMRKCKCNCMTGQQRQRQKSLAVV